MWEEFSKHRGKGAVHGSLDDGVELWHCVGADVERSNHGHTAECSMSVGVGARPCRHAHLARKQVEVLVALAHRLPSREVGGAVPAKPAVEPCLGWRTRRWFDDEHLVVARVTQIHQIKATFLHAHYTVLTT